MILKLGLRIFQFLDVIHLLSDQTKVTLYLKTTAQSLGH